MVKLKNRIRSARHGNSKKEHKPDPEQNLSRTAKTNTSYFLNLEKRNAQNNTISALTRENGSIAFSQADVLDEQVNFYSTLYKEDTGLSNANGSYITDFLGKTASHHN